MAGRIAGREWAYIGAGLGGAVSIAANVAHSYVPPAAAPVGWAPPFGAVIASVFWPVALFVAIEILARTAWRSGRRWVTLRFGGLIPVAAVAAVVSYRHLSGLLGFYGEDPLTVVIGPLAVDGLMVMATGALIATSTPRRVAPALVAVPAADAAPEGVPADVPAAPVPAARLAVPAETVPVPASGTRNRSRTGTPRTRRAGRTGKPAGTRTDADLIAALAEVPREPDGTVPVRRAAAALGTGPDRARRLLDTAGLLRAAASVVPLSTIDPEPAAPVPVAA